MSISANLFPANNAFVLTWVFAESYVKLYYYFLSRNTTRLCVHASNEVIDSFNAFIALIVEISNLWTIFILAHAQRGLCCLVMSVRPSVRPSHAAIVFKRPENDLKTFSTVW